MMGVRDFETQIWGKPLDKKMWEKGELRNIKVKFVWRKKGSKKKPSFIKRFFKKFKRKKK